MFEFSALFVCGLLVGSVGAFFGIGGGIIIIPLLTLLFDYPVHQAVATSLVVIMANSLSVSIKNIVSGFINIDLALFISIFSIVGAVCGGFIGLGLSAGSLYITLGCAQLLSAFIMLYKKHLPLLKLTSPGVFASQYDENGKNITYDIKNPVILGVVAALNGILSGMVGVGGGVVIVPAMNIISGVPIKVATSTSGYIMGMTASGGAVVYFLSGHTNLSAVAAMVPSIYISSHLASKVFAKTNSAKVYRAFIYLLLFVAFYMLYKGVKGI